ncbi:MAG: 6,7-dimethyl-8-ribityllumazine synthase [Chloroflexi bacterium]|nr:6,7-dimethyl-8-ribityllumazine synthase [Chloroflexota bacterium]
MVTEPLLEGALQAFREQGLPESAVDVAWVPGSFELPLVARRLAASGGYHGVVCLGAVIEGDTTHFEHVSREAASGIAAAAQETGVPIMFGVLTTHTLEQAMERAGGKRGNEGHKAALGVLEMASLLDGLP